MNKAQRMGVFVAVAAVLAVVVLHSPWTGYFYVGMPYNVEGLPFESYQEFEYLSTRLPLSRWFGNALHCLIALGVVGVLLAAWHWAARDTKSA